MLPKYMDQYITHPPWYLPHTRSVARTKADITVCSGVWVPLDVIHWVRNYACVGDGRAIAHLHQEAHGVVPATEMA